MWSGEGVSPAIAGYADLARLEKAPSTRSATLTAWYDLVRRVERPNRQPSHQGAYSLTVAGLKRVCLRARPGGGSRTLSCRPASVHRTMSRSEAVSCQLRRRPPPSIVRGQYADISAAKVLWGDQRRVGTSQLPGHCQDHGEAAP
jgi:hypothetical protein